jgi:hypothetical protein
MSTQRQRAIQIAEATKLRTLALFDTIDDLDEFASVAQLAIMAGVTKSWTLADLGIAQAIGRLPLGLVPAPTVTHRVEVALRTLIRVEEPRIRIGRMAHAIPLSEWRSGRTEAMVRQEVRGWTRATGPDPCPLCTSLADGAVLPPDAQMIEHPGCSCVQQVVA